MLPKLLVSGLLGCTLWATTASAQTPPANAPAASTTITAPMATTGNWRTSKFIGLDVYNEQNEKLGDINELLIDHTGKIHAVIIGVGGFLGMGERDISVAFDQLKWVNEPVRVSAPATTPAPATTGTLRGSTAETRTTGPTTSTAAIRRDDDRKWYPDHAVLSGTKDQLKAMPQFKYE